MKTLSKSIAIASLVAACGMNAQISNAEVEFNAAAQSDYVWRGMTTTDNNFSVNGGVDYSHDTGVYLGAWAGNVDFADDAGPTVEVDLYAGYYTEVGEFALDLGYITYNYDKAAADYDTTELYFSVATGAMSAMYSTDPDGVLGSYIEGGYDLDLPQEIALSLHAGYSLPEEGDSITDFASTFSKSLEAVDLSLTVSYIEDNAYGEGEAETIAFVSVSKGF